MMHMLSTGIHRAKMLQAKDVAKKPSFAERQCGEFRPFIAGCALAPIALVSENVAGIESA